MQYFIYFQQNGTTFYYQDSGELGVCVFDDYTSEYDEAKFFDTYREAEEKKKDLVSKQQFFIGTTENIF